MLPLHAPWPDPASDDDANALPCMWMEGDSLAPYLGTPSEWLESILNLAKVDARDIVLDIGCGDGRIPIWAIVRFGAKAGIGIEIEENLARRALQNAAARGAAPHFRVIQADVTDGANVHISAALGDATLLTIFLLPDALELIKPLIHRHLMRRDIDNNRVLCLGWALRHLNPIAVATIGQDTGGGLDVFLFDRTSLPSEIARDT